MMTNPVIADLVELAAGEDGARSADRLHLVDRPLHDARTHALLRRHRQRAALQEQALAVAIMRPVMGAERHVALLCPALQSVLVVSDELAGVHSSRRSCSGMTRTGASTSC